jgi:ferric-dicitrate binding protein FerR (iron transport regulator)
LSVPAGQYAQLTLADGSEIWLNSCSKIVYPERFTSATRVIQLEGEGLFRVASDVKRPFTVKTDKLDVIATGTQFNVSAYPNENQVSATLIEGVVKLHSFANDIDFEINAGQIAVYDKLTQKISAQNTDTDMHISWIHGEYQFREMPLEEITKRLTRYFNLTFVFHDEALKQRKFTGTFYNQQSIENILQLIMTSGKMRYTMEKDTVIVFSH